MGSSSRVHPYLQFSCLVLYLFSDNSLYLFACTLHLIILTSDPGVMWHIRRTLFASLIFFFVQSIHASYSPVLIFFTVERVDESFIITDNLDTKGIGNIWLCILLRFPFVVFWFWSVWCVPHSQSGCSCTLQEEGMKLSAKSKKKRKQHVSCLGIIFLCLG